jgi:glycosyltransferase involved in cell wall biosynthesis
VKNGSDWRPDGRAALRKALELAPPHAEVLPLAPIVLREIDTGGDGRPGSGKALGRRRGTNAGTAVLHVVPVLDAHGSFGGPAALALDLGRRQTSAGFDVTVAACSGDGAAPVGLDGEPVRVVVKRGHLWGGRPARATSARLALWLVRHLPRHQVVHLHGFREPLSLFVLGAARLFRRPVVLHLHGMLEAAVAADRRTVGLVRMVAGPHVRAVALTERESADAGRLLQVPVVTLPNAVPEVAYTPHADAGPVLFCARLHPRKGVALFLQAMESVLARDESVVVHVVGPDEGDGDLVRRAEHTSGGRLRYLGGLPGAAARDEIAAADVLVVTAVNEPSGLTLLEALAAGTPVVAVPAGPLGEALAAAGAITSVPADADAIAQAVIRLRTDPDLRRDQIERARTWLHENASFDSFAAAVVEEYRRLGVRIQGAAAGSSE